MAQTILNRGVQLDQFRKPAYMTASYSCSSQFQLVMSIPSVQNLLERLSRSASAQVHFNFTRRLARSAPSGLRKPRCGHSRYTTSKGKTNVTNQSKIVWVEVIVAYYNVLSRQAWEA